MYNNPHLLMGADYSLAAHQPNNQTHLPEQTGHPNPIAWADT